MANAPLAAYNRRILLARRPAGAPQPEDFRIVDEPMPVPPEGEVLVEVLFLSLDPYMRGRMNDVKSYVPPIKLGEVMGGGVVGRVVRSETPDMPPGTIVEGMLGWQTHATAKPGWLRIIDPGLAPVPTALGVLGMPGLTAYFGLLDICKPKAGETVVVSAASGAVGGIVGQLATMQGCRVIGTVGSDDKAAYITEELGYDAALNYRTESHLGRALAALCPEGIDVYFDNVGGPVTDAVINNLATRARIAICGQISQYNAERPKTGPRNLWKLVTTRSRMEGFLVADFREGYPGALAKLATWVSEGRLKYREDIVRSLDNAPAAFIGLLEGRNFGKLLVQVADDERIP